MKALIVLDVQKGFVEQKDYSAVLNNIDCMIQSFRQNKEPVIFTRHVDRNAESAIFYEKEESQIVNELISYADYIIEKETADAFYHTKLSDLLARHHVDQIVITGFNTEYCCLFTAIAGFDRNYKVTFVEDATGTVNDAKAYEMPGLDIGDFVGSVLYCSGMIEDVDTKEYLEKYNTDRLMLQMERTNEVEEM